MENHCSDAPVGIDAPPPTLRPPPLPVAPLRLPGLWAALGLIGLYFAVQFGVSMVIAIGLGVVFALKSPGSATAVSVQAAVQDPTGMALLVLCSLGVAAPLTLWLARRKWPQLWSMARPPGFGFAMPPQGGFFALAVVLGLATPILGGLLTQLLAHGHPVTQDIAKIGVQTPVGLRIPLALIIVSLGPWVEELLFRGVLLSALLRKFRVGVAVVLSAMVFAAIHLPGLQFQWYALPDLMLLALLLAWLRLRSDSIWPAVVAHGTNNLLAVALWFGLLQGLG